ncbi:MAG: NYN domain-containing protein [Lentisphaerota bacterium]
MSFIDKIRSMFSSEGGGESRSAKRLYLMDAAKILDDKAGRIGPREQLQVLQQLSRFASQEKVRITAVFEGRPLREVENGGEFSGITVYFAEQSSAVQEQIVRLFKKESPRAVVVVTSDAQLEKTVADQGGATLRVSTFRKAMGSNGGGNGGGGGGHGDRSRMQGGRRRHFRQRPPSRPGDQESTGGESPASEQQSEPQQPRPQQPQGGGDHGEKDSVRSLIDLVE